VDLRTNRGESGTAEYYIFVGYADPMNSNTVAGLKGTVNNKKSNIWKARTCI
jgi:hypothetical protein